MAFAAENGGDASLRAFLPHLALGGPADERLWMDAAGGGAADVGDLRVAPGARGETGAQDQKLDQPEDFDVCAGGGICADSAVVAAGGAAFGENDVDPVAVSGVAVRDFLGRDSDCGDRALLQGGDAQFAPGQREDVVAGEPGGAGDVYGVDAGGLVVDVAALWSAGALLPLLPGKPSSSHFVLPITLILQSGGRAAALQNGKSFEW